MPDLAHVAASHGTSPVKPHLLACTQHDWSCSGGHASGLMIVIVLAIMAALAGIGALFKKR